MKLQTSPFQDADIFVIFREVPLEELCDLLNIIRPRSVECHLKWSKLTPSSDAIMYESTGMPLRWHCVSSPRTTLAARAIMVNSISVDA